MQSQDTFRQNMNETSKTSKDIDNLLFNTNNKLINLKNESNEIEKLKLDNQNLQDFIRQLEQKIEEINSSKLNDKEIALIKEANENLKIDRRKLKFERLNLLNQIKELYKTIEAKENEIRDFLRHYEIKTKETSCAVKRLIEAKCEIENDRNKYLNENLSLIDQNKHLKILLENKDETIKILQQQINEAKTKWTRYSYSKESDYGYVSSKSRDTLCNSIISETNMLNLNCETVSHRSTLTNSHVRDSVSSDGMTNSIMVVRSTEPISNANLNTRPNTQAATATSNEKKLEIHLVDQNINTNTTSPTTSLASSYCATNASEDITKDLHASLPIMNYSLTVCDDVAHKTTNLMSMSLNIATNNNPFAKTTTVTSDNNGKTYVSSIDAVSSSNEDTSSGSIFLTNSYSSATTNATASNKAGYYKINNNKLDNIVNISNENVDNWSQNTIKLWLESIGMLATHIKNALKYVKNGKVLLSLTENDLENVFFISNQMHKRKIKLALDELKYPEKFKHKHLTNISNKWVCNQFLSDIGLKQYQSTFKSNLIDGRVLASLQRKDLEKYLGIHKRIHQTSILASIDLLKKYDFNIETINTLREMNQDKDPLLWTNNAFRSWLKLVNLQSYEDNLDESGLHGALILDNTFNVDYVYEALRIDDQKNQIQKKLIEEEIKLLKRCRNLKQESVFQRSLSSFKTDKKLFNLRGSLGRALGKKAKRDISSPLIDDITYRRIENNHKIVDVKSFHISSVV